MQGLRATLSPPSPTRFREDLETSRITQADIEDLSSQIDELLERGRKLRELKMSVSKMSPTIAPDANMLALLNATDPLFCESRLPAPSVLTPSPVAAESCSALLKQDRFVTDPNVHVRLGATIPSSEFSVLSVESLGEYPSTALRVSIRSNREVVWLEVWHKTSGELLGVGRANVGKAIELTPQLEVSCYSLCGSDLIAVVQVVRQFRQSPLVPVGRLERPNQTSTLLVLDEQDRAMVDEATGDDPVEVMLSEKVVSSKRVSGRGQSLESRPQSALQDAPGRMVELLDRGVGGSRTLVSSEGVSAKGSWSDSWTDSNRGVSEANTMHIFFPTDDLLDTADPETVRQQHYRNMRELERLTRRLRGEDVTEDEKEDRMKEGQIEEGLIPGEKVMSVQGGKEGQPGEAKLVEGAQKVLEKTTQKIIQYDPPKETSKDTTKDPTFRPPPLRRRQFRRGRYGVGRKRGQSLKQCPPDQSINQGLEQCSPPPVDCSPLIDSISGGPERIAQHFPDRQRTSSVQASSSPSTVVFSPRKRCSVSLQTHVAQVVISGPSLVQTSQPVVQLGPSLESLRKESIQTARRNISHIRRALKMTVVDRGGSVGC